jgi:pimeloyl-ACP methyl ester carboxylesterase
MGAVGSLLAGAQRSQPRGCRASLAPDTIRNWQYSTGADPSLLSPDGYELDIAYMARPGAEEIQLDLILDYRTNVARYPDFQAHFRKHRPPLLAVWGRHDPPLCLQVRRPIDVICRNAQIHLLDTGHFALETHAKEAAALIAPFLASTVDSGTASTYV